MPKPPETTLKLLNEDSSYDEQYWPGRRTDGPKYIWPDPSRGLTSWAYRYHLFDAPPNAKRRALFFAGSSTTFMHYYPGGASTSSYVPV